MNNTGFVSAGHSATQERDQLRERFLSLETPRDVADLLATPYDRLIYLAYKKPPQEKYSQFKIRKKAGGVRTITAPCAAVKTIQRRLSKVLQAVYRVKPCVHGFAKERSIVSNATRHKKQRYVLNVDLRDFFPSVNKGRVWGLFRAKPYECAPNVAKLLAVICCHQNALPQGAPTSPVVSNMICRRMDRQLQRLAREERCIYTRYADDITFSTSLPIFPGTLAIEQPGGQLKIGEQLARIIRNNGFEINQKKMRLQGRNQRQEVTGLTTNVFVNVPRRLLRQIRAMLHAWHNHGLEAAEREYVDRYARKHRAPYRDQVSFRSVVLGKINFVRMVRGENDSYFKRFRQLALACDKSVKDILGEENPDVTETKEKLEVFVEGETDPKYITTALDLLLRSDLLQTLRLTWIGTETKEGRRMFTGKGALDNARNFYLANPQSIRHPSLFLYDCDVNKQDENRNRFWVRGIPKNDKNTKVTAGIENLLPSSLFEDKFYTQKEVPKPDGGRADVWELKKTVFCRWVCDERRDARDFEGFRPVIALLDEFVKEFTD